VQSDAHEGGGDRVNASLGLAFRPHTDLRPTSGDESGCHPEPLAVTLSAAEGLHFRAVAN